MFAILEQDSASAKPDGRVLTATLAHRVTTERDASLAIAQ